MRTWWAKFLDSETYFVRFVKTALLVPIVYHLASKNGMTIEDMMSVAAAFLYGIAPGSARTRNDAEALVKSVVEKVVAPEAINP